MCSSPITPRILPIAKACHIAELRATSAVAKRRFHTYVLDLWGLFASFCVCTDDCATAVPAFCTSIIGAMTDKTYPELGVIVCKGLALLIRSNQMALGDPRAEEEVEKDEDDSESVMSEEEPKASQEDAEDEQVLLCLVLHCSFPSSAFFHPLAPQEFRGTWHRRTSRRCRSSARTSC